MKHSLLFLPAFVLLLASSCSKKNPTEPIILYNQSTYFPVQVAYKWSYAISMVYKDSAGKLDSIVTFQHYDVVVIKDTIVSGLRIIWFQERWPAELMTYQYIVEDDSVVSPNDRMGTALKWLQFPLLSGQTWDAMNQTTMTVKSLTETITVAAGTFEHCVLIEQRSKWNLGLDDLYYSPNVGRVCSISYSDSTHRNSYTLTELASKNF